MLQESLQLFRRNPFITPPCGYNNKALSSHTISTLESICTGFGITLAQFFAEGELVELNQEQKEMFAAWSALTKPQKEALRQLIDVMKM